MKVYRIVKTQARTSDLSGKGAFMVGGRWNSEGTFMLYTSVNKSLALLENLVHYDQSELPAEMYMMEIEIDDSYSSLIYDYPDEELPADWREPENIALKVKGDKIFSKKKYLGIKVRSAVVPSEYNILLDPMFPRYYDMVKVTNNEPLQVDKRLGK